MTQRINLPFKVGHEVEVKSFELGYRGAWFKCEILKIEKQKKKLHYSLKYLDFPEEEIHNTQVFQEFPNGNETVLMVRPPRPPHYHESEVHKIKNAVEPLIVIHESWRVGDLVDWWKDDCFWSATILEFKGEEKVQVELLQEPFGEGQNYEALLKDLSPCLEWSPDDGWKLPFVVGQRKQCARLVTRNNEGVSEPRKEQTRRVMTLSSKGKEGVSEPRKVKTKRVTTLSSKGMEGVSDPRKMQTNGVMTPSSKGKEAVSETRKEQTTNGVMTEQSKGKEELRLNIMTSDLIEAPVFDLEELSVKLQWIKEKILSVAEESDNSWRCDDHLPSDSGV